MNPNYQQLTNKCSMGFKKNSNKDSFSTLPTNVNNFNFYFGADENRKIYTFHIIHCFFSGGEKIRKEKSVVFCALILYNLSCFLFAIILSVFILFFFESVIIGAPH